MRAASLFSNTQSSDWPRVQYDLNPGRFLYSPLVERGVCACTGFYSTLQAPGIKKKRLAEWCTGGESGSERLYPSAGCRPPSCFYRPSQRLSSG